MKKTPNPDTGRWVGAIHHSEVVEELTTLTPEPRLIENSALMQFAYVLGLIGLAGGCWSGLELASGLMSETAALFFQTLTALTVFAMLTQVYRVESLDSSFWHTLRSAWWRILELFNPGRCVRRRTVERGLKIPVDVELSFEGDTHTLAWQARPEDAKVLWQTEVTSRRRKPSPNPLPWVDRVQMRLRDRKVALELFAKPGGRLVALELRDTRSGRRFVIEMGPWHRHKVKQMKLPMLDRSGVQFLESTRTKMVAKLVRAAQAHGAAIPRGLAQVGGKARL